MNFKWNTHVLDVATCKRTSLGIRFSGLSQKITKSFSTLVGLSLMLGFACLTGCNDETFQDSQGNEGPGIGFTTSVVETDLVSRGTPITAAASLTNMGVFCYPTGFNSWATAGTSATPTLMNNLLFTQSGGKWSSSPAVGWGADVSVAQKFTFFGYTPQATAANGLSVLSTTGTPKLRYTVPTTIGDQPDLMIAASKDIHPTSGQVPLAYKHALTCLAFNVKGAGGEKITAIKVKGVRVTGDLTWAADGTPVWSNLGAATSTTYSVGLKDGLVNVTTSYQDALATDGYLMMIPQTLASGAQLVVSIEGKADKVFDLTNQTTTTWTAGQRLTYNISLQPPVITVGPRYFLLATPGSHPAFSKIEVTSSVPTEGAWTLTSTNTTANTDFKMSLNSDGSGASTTVSGVGSQTVYAVMGPNAGLGKRTAEIKLGSTKVVDVIQAGTTTQYLQDYGYGGAFWKKNETGERVIRIPVGSSSTSMSGPWIVKVAWMDGNWNPGDIVIDAPATFPGNPFVSALGPVDNGWISGTTTQMLTGSVTAFPSGTLRENYQAENFITFRVGLKSQYTPSLGAPQVRYAIIAIGYYNGNVMQNFLLRQGEDPDYLMKTGTGDVKMSPYNLTISGSFNADGYAEVAQNGGVFTQYPTQVGAFFHYANKDYPRRAYSPVLVSKGWSSNYKVFDSTEETCPPGYRRPTTHYVTDSDIKKYFTGAGYVSTYYADGFFDRQKMEDGDATESRCQDRIVLKDDAKQKGAAGVVAYNPTTGASIFIPASGVAYNGAMESDGEYGFYWGSDMSSTTAYDFGIFYVYSMFPEWGMRTSSKRDSSGSFIRCVKTD